MQSKRLRDGGMDRAREKQKVDLTTERRRSQAAQTGREPVRPSASFSTVHDFGLLTEVVSASVDLLTSFLDP